MSGNLNEASDLLRRMASGDGGAAAELFVTTTKPWRGLFERAAYANNSHADLFIAIHHDSVPDNLKQTWEYAGLQQQYNDDYPGYAIFISNDNADRAGSLLFGHLLGKQLERADSPVVVRFEAVGSTSDLVE